MASKKFVDDDYGARAGRYQIAAKPVRRVWKRGEVPAIDVRVLNSTKNADGSRNRQSIVGHARPASFAIEIDGEKYRYNEVAADWQRKLSPGDWMDCRLPMDDRYNAGRNSIIDPSGKHTMQLGKPINLEPGVYQIRVIYSEPQGAKQAVSKPFEIEIQ